MSIQEKLQYNTQQSRLPLPEYGRSVQHMVEHALTITDRAERQRCANTIIRIMAGMFPQMHEMADFHKKLWDHLAIMSGFRLDIDYPEGLIKPEALLIKPEKVPYSKSIIRYRHYGKHIQDLIHIAKDMEAGDMRNQLIELTVNYMKKDYNTWNKEGVENGKIIEDLLELSEGKIRIEEQDIRFYEGKTANANKFNNNGKKKKKKAKNKTK
ncbi:MAG: DUF4290 domain-containing protein [Phocaeicola sp.]|nr:DUF4290 domain-containing protein [Phocaeicola sp.]